MTVQSFRTAEVHTLVANVAAIEGISFGKLDDKATWRIEFAGGVSDADKAAAQAVLNAFDLSEPTIKDIINERERRLSLGFDYDFADARGVHHIGTTPEDMVGWRDVIDYANALIDSGDTTTKIAIVTDTGPAEVTAPEWQAIMLVAASVRQNIWAKSFALQGMSPIPGDYANDSYWSQ